MKNHYIISQNLFATKGLRFANYVIDYFVIFVLTSLVIMVVMFFSEISGLDSQSYFAGIEDMNRLEEYLFGLLITIPYYILMEGISSRTIGKYITGTIVVDNEGNKPSMETFIKRSFCRAIPFDAVSFLGENSRGWHDSIPDTYVVNKKMLEAEKQNYFEMDEIGKTNLELQEGYSN